MSSQLTISGKTVEKDGSFHSVSESMMIPDKGEKVMQFCLNSKRTKGVGVWRNPRGEVEILEWKPYQGTVEIVHHKVVADESYVFRQFSILDRWALKRKLSFGAKVRISPVSA